MMFKTKMKLKPEFIFLEEPIHYSLELFVKSPYIWACFNLLSPLSVICTKYENFIESLNEMLKLSI
jgi:hypothetical protein